jgi:hypothetical protein
MSETNQMNRRNGSNRKRISLEVSGVDQINGNQTDAIKGDAETKAAPNYGSLDYWEERYASQFRNSNVLQKNNQQGDKRKKNRRLEHHNRELDDYVIEPRNNVDDLHPHHDWYFEYSELRPLILPILLGGREDLNEIMANIQDDTSNDSDDESLAIQHNNEKGQGNEADEQSSENISESSHEEISEYVSGDNVKKESSARDTDCITENAETNDTRQCDEIEECSSGDETNEDCIRDGLAKDGPVRILEVSFEV